MNFPGNALASEVPGVDVDPPHVFIVDDDPLTRQLIAHLLEKDGYLPIVYASATEFLNSYSDEPGAVRCLISDICMPDIDGWQLQAALLHKDIQIPTIFLTGHANVDGAVFSLQAGAADFLQKPVHVERLRSSVARIFEQESARCQKADGVRRFFDLLARLTPREREVFDLLVAGADAKQVAKALAISAKMAFVHRARVLDKMEVDNPVALFRNAYAAGYQVA